MPHEDYRELNAEGFARQARAAELEGWSGWPTPAHWLQWRCGYSLGAARERFHVVRALPELPQIREAFRAGRLYRRYGENAAAMNQHRERSFTSWEEDDGMVSFRIRLPAEQAAVVLKAIEAARASLDGRDREDDVSAETFCCEWDGAPPDYGALVQLLDQDLRDHS
jgi:hypothetical protein